jgi:XTP/dITP diphosphohydrolase
LLAVASVAFTAEEPHLHRNNVRLLLASSNPGKLREFRALAAAETRARNIDIELELDPFPGFAEFPPFAESALTFAENAAGKALHYSRFNDLPVMADDSGLVVAALDGAPGVLSARYAGTGASDADRIAKLEEELRRAGAAKGSSPDHPLDRGACFVCVIALAARGRVAAVLSDDVRGEILERPRGAAGFGYDPVFLYPPLGKTFAEMREEEKNKHSHRGKAFRKMLEFLASSPVL